MVETRNLGWELLGFGLIVGGPVVGAVIVSNKSPVAWLAVCTVATKLCSDLGWRGLGCDGRVS